MPKALVFTLKLGKGVKIPRVFEIFAELTSQPWTNVRELKNGSIIYQLSVQGTKEEAEAARAEALRRVSAEEEMSVNTGASSSSSSSSSSAMQNSQGVNQGNTGLEGLFQQIQVQETEVAQVPQAAAAAVEQMTAMMDSMKLGLEWGGEKKGGRRKRKMRTRKEKRNRRRTQRK